MPEIRESMECMEINPVSAKIRAQFYTFNPLRSGHGLSRTHFLHVSIACWTKLTHVHMVIVYNLKFASRVRNQEGHIRFTCRYASPVTLTVCVRQNAVALKKVESKLLLSGTFFEKKKWFHPLKVEPFFPLQQPSRHVM